MTTRKLDIDLQDQADAALDAILTIRLALGGLPALPHHGLDKALLADEGYQGAKDRAHRAWAPLVEKANDPRASMRADPRTDWSS